MCSIIALPWILLSGFPEKRDAAILAGITPMIFIWYPRNYCGSKYKPALPTLHCPHRPCKGKTCVDSILDNKEFINFLF